MKHLIKKYCISCNSFQTIKYFIGLMLLIFVFLFMGCAKFVDVDPPKYQVSRETVFSSDATAIAAITGIYSTIMAGQFSFLGGGLPFYTGLSSDELTNYSAQSAQIELYQNSVSEANTIIFNQWSNAYSIIYAANSVLEGLSGNQSVSSSVRDQLEGEALFIRSLCYFYLVNLWGEVPFLTSTDYNGSAIAYKSSEADIYKKIVEDLKKAQTLLSVEYVSTERVRPNQYTATALLARTYLYMGDWSNAAAEATKIINAPDYHLTDNVNEVFLKNSSETIWQLMPVMTNYNTNDGANFILTGVPTSCALSNQFVTSFNLTDKRRINWIDSISVGGTAYYFPYKYKIRSSSSLNEYQIVFRLAEQYLIRAEARAKNNDIQGAVEDLNLVHERAGLAKLSQPPTADSCLNLIENERKQELFCEYGHRWLDLKRTNRANQVLGNIKPGWQSSDQYYPIPASEILNNPHLGI